MTGEVDYGWVLEVTFVLTVLIGAPLIAVGSIFVDLPTWTARVTYATMVAAAVWLITAVIVYLYARGRLRPGRGDDGR